MEMKIIARVESDFSTKFGIPRQSGIAKGLTSRVIFEPEYRDAHAVRGLEEFSHIWLIWQFSGNIREGWSPTVRPPRLGGNTRIGVFATRSPFRPNEIGLSSVKLEKIEYSSRGPMLIISGADLMDGTPIFDIKPYLPFTDSHPEAVSGFAERVADYSLNVEFNCDFPADFPENKKEALKIVLENDPRPSYKEDSHHLYGFVFAGFEIKFSVENGVLKVKEIYPSL